jgi:hypothetical protein
MSTLSTDDSAATDDPATMTIDDSAAISRSAVTGDLRADGRPAAPTADRGRRRWFGVAGALVAAWAAPVTTHALGVDWLMPAAVVVVLMGLQRGPRTVLDRFVLAVVQIFGTLCVAGLLYTVWPWHLHPVPIAGTALTALIAFAVLSGRSWQVPLRVPPGDRLVALTVLGVTALTMVPFAWRDLGGRIGLVMPGEDMARHFLLYDVIGLAGGYAFGNLDQVRAVAPDDLVMGIGNYPQGVHFGYAVLDRFIRSSAHNTDTVTQLDTMLWMLVATFLFLVLCVTWSLRRIAGPGADAVRMVPALVVVATWMYFGDLVTVMLRGFPNQLVGLALAAVLTAVTVRPLRGLEQLATVATLLVGISFSYHLYLPYAVLVAAVWAWRERLWRSPAAVVTAILLAPVILLTPLLNLHAASVNQLSQAGTALYIDAPAVVLLVVLAAVGLWWRGGFRSPARRFGMVALAINVGLVLALATFQLVTVGRTVYYFDKLLHLTLVTGLVLLGAWVRLTPRRARPVVAGSAGAPVGVLRRLRAASAGLALVLPIVAVLVAFGGPTHTDPGSYGLRLATGVDKGSPAGGRDALMLWQRHPDGGGAVDVDLMSTPYRNFFATVFASAIQRTYRHGHLWYVFMSVATAPKTIADLDAAVQATQVPVRFYVYNPRASMLVVDPAHPNREWTRPGADPAAFGDPAAMTNIEAAEYLAKKYPGKVEVVYAVPPNR